MIRLLKSLTFLGVLSAACLAQTAGSAQTDTAASANAAGQTTSASSQTTVQAVLTKSIDAKKAKPGDKVEARTEQKAMVAGTTLPRGTKLIGHIVEAKPQVKGSGDSSVAIVFDNAILKTKQSVLFHAVIVAAAAPAPSALMPDSSMDASGSAGTMDRSAPAAGRPLSGVGSAAGGAIGSTGQTVGGVTRDTGNVVGSVANPNIGTAANAKVGAARPGSMGIPGVTLSASAANQTNSSVFTSNSGNVKLSSGTTLVLHVMGQ